MEVTKSLMVEDTRSKTSHLSKDTFNSGLNFSLVLAVGETKVLPLSGLPVIKSFDVVADGRLSVDLGGQHFIGTALSQSGQCIVADKMTIVNKGKQVQTLEVIAVEDEVVSSDTEGTYYALTIVGKNFGRGSFVTKKVEGTYQSYEGKSFYISESNRSEAKVTLLNIGQYDELGNKYVYDPVNADMEFRFSDSGVSYGKYKIVRGEIFANDLQRCINEQFGADFCVVTYEDERFRININRDHCISFVIRDNPPSYAATMIGLTDGIFTPSDESVKGLSLAVGDSLYPIISSVGDKIVIKDPGNVVPETGNQIFPLSVFASSGGDFGSMCTDVHCNVSGTYRIFPNQNKPEMYSKIKMVQGILYTISCWKILDSEGAVIDTDSLVVLWDRTSHSCPEDAVIEWPNGFVTPRYIDVVRPGAISLSVYVYGE